MDCASRLLTCVQGFHDAPGLVGGPVSGTLMDVLSGHRCRRTWCSSAKRENFNSFSLSLKNQRSNATLDCDENSNTNTRTQVRQKNSVLRVLA